MMNIITYHSGIKVHLKWDNLGYTTWRLHRLEYFCLSTPQLFVRIIIKLNDSYVILFTTYMYLTCIQACIALHTAEVADNMQKTNMSILNTHILGHL